MNIVRRTVPGKTITLYDYSQHSRFRGTLYFDQKSYNQQLPTVHKTGKHGFNFSKALAIFSLTIAVMGFSSVVAPIAMSEISLRLMMAQAKKTEQRTVPTPEPVVSNSPLPVTAPEPVIQTEQTDQFFMAIPKVNLESDVIANVNVNLPEEYNEALKHGVAHALGSYLPDQQLGPTILFAHSTDSILNLTQWNAKFYAVRELEEGDEIIVQYKNKRYKYAVQEKQIINPTDIQTIQDTTANLVLVTCYPPGTDWQRLVIFAKLVN